MSFLEWLLIGTILALYLLFGGSVFMFIEQGNELHQQAEFNTLRKDIQDILLGLDQEFYNNGTPPEILEAIKQAKEGVITRISETCGGKNLLDVNSTETILRWTLYNSVFYAFTAITTIGYGNMTAETQWSRIFTIFYALIGIPLNGIILTKISDMYNRKLVNVHNRAKATESRITFAFNVIFYLIPGLLLFIIIPAAFFVVIENWGYLDAIYFCFVSLTTIGFGDYVAGTGDGHNVWLWVYKITIIFWIVFGLGYLVMILGFITKGITSNQVRGVLEKKLNRIRITREKLAKDVDYMRKVATELYLTNPDAGFICTQSNDTTLDNYSEDSQQFNFQRSKSFYIPRGSCSGEVDISLIRSFSESDVDRFSNRLVVVDGEEKGRDRFLVQLVASLEGNITDVLKAVEDFDTYEVRSNENAVEEPETEEHLDRNILAECSDLTEKRNPTWSFTGIVNEIDDEVQLNFEEEGEGRSLTLNEIVVHKLHPSAKPGGILEKVTGVLRKISSGSMKGTSSEPSSRKVSRNEDENKNRAVVSKFQNGTSNQSAQESNMNGARLSSYRHTSERDHNCNVDPFPRNSSQTFCGSDNESSSTECGTPRRKISKPGKSLSRNISLDPNTLAEFIKVLDEVEERLADDDCFFPSAYTSEEGASNYGFVASNESSPSVRRDPSRLSINRSRKLGIFNPEFKYFSPGLTGSASKARGGLEFSVQTT